MEVSSGIGYIIGPLIGTLLYMLGGYIIPFLFCAFLYLLSIPIVFYMIPSDSLFSSPAESDE